MWVETLTVPVNFHCLRACNLKVALATCDSFCWVGSQIIHFVGLRKVYVSPLEILKHEY